MCCVRLDKTEGARTWNFVEKYYVKVCTNSRPGVDRLLYMLLNISTTKKYFIILQKMSLKGDEQE